MIDVGVREYAGPFLSTNKQTRNSRKQSEAKRVRKGSSSQSASPLRFFFFSFCGAADGKCGFPLRMWIPERDIRKNKKSGRIKRSGKERRASTRSTSQCVHCVVLAMLPRTLSAAQQKNSGEAVCMPSGSSLFSFPLCWSAERQPYCLPISLFFLLHAKHRGSGREPERSDVCVCQLQVDSVPSFLPCPSTQNKKGVQYITAWVVQ